MKSFYSLFLILCSGLLLAEENTESAPTRKRRIIVYDQSPRLVAPVTPLSLDAEADQHRRKLLEREGAQPGPGSDFSNPAAGPLNLAPMMPSQTPVAEEEEEEEWITREDLLSADELLETDLTDPEEEKPAEIEIADWESLQQQLIEDEIRGGTEAQERVKEEVMEDMLAEAGERDLRSTTADVEENERTGLGMETVLDSDNGSGLQLGVSGAEENSVDRAATANRISPVLQPVLLMGDQRTPPSGNSTVTRNEGFSGSRKLLEDIQGRWERRERAETAAASRPEGFSMPGRADSLDSPSLPQSQQPVQTPNVRLEPVRFSNPAPESLSRNQPSSNRPSASPDSQPGPRQEPRDRIRSRLGAGAGF